MIPAFNASHVSPDIEKIIGDVMKTMCIKEGHAPIRGKACSIVMEYGERLLRYMDGGATTYRDAIDLSDTGEADFMARAIERLTGQAVLVRTGDVLHYTSKADAWLDDHGRQGKLYF